MKNRRIKRNIIFSVFTIIALLIILFIIFGLGTQGIVDCEIGAQIIYFIGAFSLGRILELGAIKATDAIMWRIR